MTAETVLEEVKTIRRMFNNSLNDTRRDRQALKLYREILVQVAGENPNSSELAFTALKLRT